MATEASGGTEKDAPGSLDLLRLFQAEAARLLLSVEEGRILHSTKNIRDSGAPLEAAFRAFLNGRLPQPFEVHHGYLFDPRSVCTPQIDLVVSDAEQSSFMLSSGEGATYTPFTAAYIIGEIKASANGAGAHLAQISSRLKAVDAMYREVGGANIERPELLSVLFIADATDVSYRKIYDFLSNQGNKRPTYIVLLSKAELIAGTNAFFATSTLDFGERGGNFAVYGPSAPDDIDEKNAEQKIQRQGHVLLWLFYAIVHHLQKKGPGRGIQPLFAEEINRRFPLQKLRDLVDVGKSPGVAVAERPS